MENWKVNGYRPHLIRQPSLDSIETLERSREYMQWYPGWNVNTEYPYNPYLDAILYEVEERKGELNCRFCKDCVMTARQTFQYRVPLSPAEEQFCRGQF